MWTPPASAFIGGSIGANMALRLGADVPQIPTVVLLSPGLNYDGVQTEPAMETFGDRPVFIVASSEDSYAAELLDHPGGPGQPSRLDASSPLRRRRPRHQHA